MHNIVRLPLKKLFIFFILIIFIFSMSFLFLPGKIYASPTTWYVDLSGTDDGSHGTVSGAGAFKTIQYAIGAAAASGDTIVVAAGTYAESLTIPKSITLIGAGASNTGTIIDPASGRCINIGSRAIVNISGFMITGGSANAGGSLDHGGGIYIYTGTLDIDDCTISGNTATGAGGGIYILDGTLDIDDCTISGNTATSNYGGGGIYIQGSTLDIDGCTISGNTANYYGGGILNGSGSTANITNSTISGNTANHHGGGIHNGSTLDITNCTISGNTTSGNGGGILNGINGTATITNSTISGNTANSGGGIYNENTSNTLTSPLNAEYNWWGSSTGPAHSSNPTGIGDIISGSGFVDYVPWLTSDPNYVAPNPLSPHLSHQDWVLKNLNIDELLALYGPTPEGFVKMLYDSILGRVPDVDGEAYWTEQLNSGVFTGSQLVEHFIFSDELGAKVEAMSNEEFITFLYSSFLSRTPDTDGFSSWVAHMDSGVSKLDTLRAFMNSQECFDIYNIFNVSP